MTTPPPPSSGPGLGSLPPAGGSSPPAGGPRRPAEPPGARRARHLRWVRVAGATTVVALAGFAAWLVLAARPRPSPEEAAAAACRRLLGGIAHEVAAFVGRRNRLPDTLFELKTPDSDSPYDADPHDGWGTPIDYHIVDGEARTFRLRSAGPDRRPDTPDDLVWPPGARWR